MKVAIILGNRINDDRSLSKFMIERLEMGIKVNEQFSPDYIIVSGGVANPIAGISEAKAMYDYLTNKGIDGNKIIIEDKSMTTKENALYSIPIAKELKATQIIVVTSIDHYAFRSYNVIELFHNALGNENIELLFYTVNREVIL